MIRSTVDRRIERFRKRRALNVDGGKSRIDFGQIGFREFDVSRRLYNRLRERQKVAGLFHTTC